MGGELDVPEGEMRVTAPTHVWLRAALIVPVTLVVTVLSIMWLIAMLIPPARAYSLNVGQQVISLVRSLLR